MKKLLMISPVIPSPMGGGLAMRMFQTLEIFLRKYLVTLWIVDIDNNQNFLPKLDLIGCKEVVYFKPGIIFKTTSLLKKISFRLFPQFYFKLFNQVSEWRYININSLKDFLAQLHEDYDIVHIARLYLWPFAKAALDKKIAKFVQLDLDDVESITRKRISHIYKLNHQLKKAKATLLEAQEYEKIELLWLSQVDRVLVCSSLDKKKLISSYQCKSVEVFPNTVKVKEIKKITKRVAKDQITIIFVASLSYYPNLDALMYFCASILPLLYQKTQKSFELNIVGNGLPSKFANCLNLPNVNLLGWVEDLSCAYGESDIAIVPLRAGGGTRIKILEAFSYGCPVVSTNIGAEGLEVTPGKNILIAYGEEDFANKVVELIEKRELRELIGREGFNCLVKHYDYENIANHLVGLGY